jgi:hypothetical protein
MHHNLITLTNGGGPPCTIQRLKAKCDEALSNFALSFNLRRYNTADAGEEAVCMNGAAVRVDPIKPTLKAPGTKLLKLEYDGTAFECWFQIQLAPLQNGYGAQILVGLCRLTL